MNDNSQPSSYIQEITNSPFGGTAHLRQTLPTAFVTEMYKRKCGVDVTQSFHGSLQIGLYKCDRTGYKFWRPKEIAGDEDLYKVLSSSWPNYYREERWEYKYARKLVEHGSRVLEIGCGRGFFYAR